MTVERRSSARVATAASHQPGAAAPTLIIQQETEEMETDCGPEDVIRWWPMSSWPSDSGGGAGGFVVQHEDENCGYEDNNCQVTSSCYDDGGKGDVEVMHRRQRGNRLFSDNIKETGECNDGDMERRSRLRIIQRSSSSSSSFCNKYLRAVMLLLCTLLVLSSMSSVEVMASRQEGELKIERLTLFL